LTFVHGGLFQVQKAERIREREKTSGGDYGMSESFCPQLVEKKIDRHGAKGVGIRRRAAGKEHQCKPTNSGPMIDVALENGSGKKGRRADAPGGQRGEAFVSK